MAKIWEINCALCDARQITEETLKAYDEVQINTGVLVTNAAARAIFGSCHVSLNCATTLDLPDGVTPRVINGSAKLGGGDVSSEQQYLIVNGSLTILPDAAEALRQCAGIVVNGALLCPQGLSSMLDKVHVNGKTSLYPDGAILLKRSAAIDRLFALRAKDAVYYAAKRLLIVDTKLDADVLVQKGARFASPEAVVAESLVEKLVPLLDEQTDIHIVPDGTKVVLDDLVLTDAAIKRYGKKLYVLGDVEVKIDAANAIAQLEYLSVHGDVTLPAALQDAFLAAADEIDGDVEITRGGTTISGRESVQITNWLLEHAADGVSVSGCRTVAIAEDVAPELIADRLTISACGKTYCTAEQHSAVLLITKDSGEICIGRPGDAQPDEDDEDDADRVTLNCAMCTL